MLKRYFDCNVAFSQGLLKDNFLFIQFFKEIDSNTVFIKMLVLTGRE